MKFTITFEVPDGTTYAIEGVSNVAPSHPEFVPPFEDELIPLPPAAIPVAGDPAPFRTMARQAMAVNQPAPGECPVHHQAWKIVPAGVSKRTGKPYDSFATCPVQGCDQRPARTA